MQCQNERTETNQEMEWQIKHIEEKQEEIQSQLISILAVSFLLLNLVRSGVELIQDSINFLTCIGAKNVAKKGFCSLRHQKNQPKNRTLQNTITWLSIMCGIKLGILKQKSKPIACNWHDCLAALVLCFSEVSSPSELLLISIPADVVSSLKNGGSV